MEENIADRNIRRKDNRKTYQCFSVAFDGKTDITDANQLAVFVHGINVYFDIIEECFQLVSTKGTTTRANILKG
uniref:DUF4371 domain-containing protein n=1 Tax=Octopus bimaculoides TaxID=37653 RepID=A0A0L8GQ91_OCTBM